MTLPTQISVTIGHIKWEVELLGGGGDLSALMPQTTAAPPRTVRTITARPDRNPNAALGTDILIKQWYPAGTY